MAELSIALCASRDALIIACWNTDTKGAVQPLADGYLLWEADHACLRGRYWIASAR